MITGRHKSFKRGVVEGIFAIIIAVATMFASYVDQVINNFKGDVDGTGNKPAIIIEESAESKKLLEEFSKKKKERELAAQEKGQPSLTAITSPGETTNQKTAPSDSSILPKNDSSKNYSDKITEQEASKTSVQAKTADRASIPILPQTREQSFFSVANILPSIVNLKCYAKDNFKAETKIESLNGGTGFFININGSDYIMAANHTVTDYNNLGNFYGCFVYTDKSINAVYPYWAGEAKQLFTKVGYLASGLPAGGLDIALLKLTNPPSFLAKFVNHTSKIENPPDVLKKLGGGCSSANLYRPPILGEELFTAGFFFSNNTSAANIKDGIVSGKANLPTGVIAIGNPNNFSTNLNLDYGFSGSPVVSKDGCFLGVATAVSFGYLSYSTDIISSSDIMAFINSADKVQVTVGAVTSSMPAILRDTRRYLDAFSDISDAIDNYLIDNNIFPQTISDLVPKYLPTEPKDPKSGYSYAYAFTRNRDFYHIGFDAEQSSLKVIIVPYGRYVSLDLTDNDSEYPDDYDFNSLEDPANWYSGFNGDENLYLNNLKKDTMTGCRLQYRAENEIRYCLDKRYKLVQNNQSLGDRENLATIFGAIEQVISTWRKWIGVK